jgi:hypothetical protein
MNPANKRRLTLAINGLLRATRHEAVAQVQFPKKVGLIRRLGLLKEKRKSHLREVIGDIVRDEY